MQSWKDSLALAASLALATPAGAAVVITEVNYHPPTAGQDTEFVEIANVGPGPADIGGWSWEAIGYTFPEGLTLAPGEVAVVAMELIDTGDANAESFEHYYGNGDGTTDEFTYFVDDYKDRLADAGEHLALLDAAGAEVDAVDYGTLPDPGAMTLERHSLTPGDFVVGAVAGGTPGELPPALLAVPEPTSMWLVAGALVLLARRRA